MFNYRTNTQQQLYMKALENFVTKLKILAKTKYEMQTLEKIENELHLKSE